MEDIKMKVCPNKDCPAGGEPQVAEDKFRKSKAQADGYAPQCKVCRARRYKNRMNKKKDPQGKKHRDPDSLRSDPERSLGTSYTGGKVDPISVSRHNKIIADLQKKHEKEIEEITKKKRIIKVVEQRIPVTYKIPRKEIADFMDLYMSDKIEVEVTIRPVEEGEQNE